LVDGDLKIFGVADGHGVNGDKVASFALSMLLNYIRNVRSSFFNAQSLYNSARSEMEHELKSAFKYV
jgi:serine/threonine protein phosphatase PrpC